jgi:simple sugar transport system ATP-binding protein
VTAAGIPAAGATKADLARLMVGRSVLEVVDRPPFRPGQTVLSVEHVRAENDRELPALRDVSLQVREGEIVGIAAVAGNGQSELAEVVTGLRPCRGEILVRGRSVANRSASAALRRGVAHVPEDRSSVGSAPNLSLTDNLIMKRYRDAPVARGWLLDDDRARGIATHLRDEYRIAAPSIDTEVRLLSGGNLQRAILAREIETNPGLLVAVQPTRGLDVGAIETVHRLLLDLRSKGAAILLISEKLDEILALADRVDVMYEGRVVGSFASDEAEIGRIGLLMTGGSDDDAGAPG